MGKFLPSLITLIFIALISMVSRFYSATPPELTAATYFGPWNLVASSIKGDPVFFDNLAHFSIQRVGVWEDPGLAVLIGFNTLFILLMLRKA